VTTPAPLSIAVDGLTGAGKSELALALANLTGLSWLETGWLYRLAARVLRAGHGPASFAVGRDVTSTLLPDADCRVYLTARQDVRQDRRTRQKGRSGLVGPPTELDESTRALLGERGGGLDIDTSDLTILEVLALVTTHLAAVGALPRRELDNPAQTR
jgi:cytidylate kinase